MRKSGIRGDSHSGACFEPLEARQLLAVIAWDGGPTGTGTDFSLASNWVGDVSPTAGDTALIDTPGAEIFIASPRNLDRLVSVRPIRIRAGALVTTTGTNELSATLFMNFATISGGVWNFSNGAGIDVIGSYTTTGAGNSLDGIITNSPIVLDVEFDRVRLLGATQTGPITSIVKSTGIDMGAGYVLNTTLTWFGSNSGVNERSLRMVANATPNNVVIAAGASIVADASFTGTLNVSQLGVNTTLVNNGQIVKQNASGAMNIQVWGLLNNGLIEFQGGSGIVQSVQPWRNTGTIRAASGTTVTLGGTLNATSGLGTLDTGSANLQILGTVQNTGNTLSFSSSTGSPTILNGQSIIEGGSIQFLDDTRFRFAEMGAILRLNNVSLLSAVAVQNGVIELSGTVSGSRIRLEGDATQLKVLTNTTLAVPIDVLATHLTQRALITLQSGTTIGATSVITLLPQSIGSLNINMTSAATLPVINLGQIVNQNGAGRIRLYGDNIFLNQGVIEATAGTMEFAVYINGDGFHNRGVIRGGAGARLELDSHFYFDTGTFEGGGSLIVVKGNAYLQGGTQTFNAQTPAISMEGGTLRTGTLVFQDGRELTIGSNQLASILRDVSVTGTIRATTNGYLGFEGPGRFTQILLTGGSRGVGFGAGYVLRDRVTVVGSGISTTRAIAFAAGSEIAPEGIVERVEGAVGTVSLTGTVVNRGLIENRHATEIFEIRLSPFTNFGTVRSTAGSIQINPSGWWSNDGILEPLNGSLISIQRIYRAAQSTGTIRGTDGYVFFQEGIDNTNNTFIVNDQTGPLYMTREINGGTVITQGSASLRTPNFGGFVQPILTDVNVQGLIVVDTNSQLTINGTTQFQTLRMQGSGSSLRIPAVYTMNGTIEFGASPAGYHTIILANAANSNWTIAPGGGLVTDFGLSSTLNVEGTGTFRVTNQGTIRASNGSNVTMNVPRLTNSGLLDVDSAALRMTNQVAAGSFNHTGTLRVQNGGLLSLTTYLDLTTSTGLLDLQFGTITFNNSTLNLGGRTINAGGVYANWFVNDSTVSNGTFLLAPGAVLSFGATQAATGSSLSGVTVAGTIVTTGGSLALASTTSFSLVRMLGPSRLSLGAGRALDGTIEVSGATAGVRTIELGFGVGSIYTIASSGVIRVLTGTGGPTTIRHANSGSIINNGSIIHESLQSITITAASFTQGGTLDIARGALVMNITGSSWTQRGTILLGDSAVLDLATSAAMSMTSTSRFVTLIRGETMFGKISGFTGNIALNGVLEAMFTAGNSVPLFSTINIINVTGGGTISGAFTTHIVTGLEEDEKSLIGQSAARFWISRTSTADFNNDLVVDLFDYLDFVQTFATGGTGSDFNGDGTIDLFDYLDFVEVFAQF